MPLRSENDRNTASPRNDPMGHKETPALHKSPAPLYDHPMTSVVGFERGHADQVVALWRMLHPDWTWLDDPAAAASRARRRPRHCACSNG
jgi:hypothetical protein